jgi:hypothetical protein
MGYKGIFTTPSQNAMEHFSGWSGVKCEICKKGTTKAASLQHEFTGSLYAEPVKVL